MWVSPGSRFQICPGIPKELEAGDAVALVEAKVVNDGDAPQIAAVFRRDFEAMDDRLFRKYGARLQLPNDAASSSDDSSDDEAEAVLASPGGFAALAAGCGDLPARPVFS